MLLYTFVEYCFRGVSLGYMGRSVKLTANLYLVTRLRLLPAVFLNSFYLIVEEYKTNLMSLAIFTSYVLNMFRTLIYPSSAACGWVGVVSVLQAEACNTDTTPTQPHRISTTHRTKNNTTNVVIQQNSRKLLKMDILMSETF